MKGKKIAYFIHDVFLGDATLHLLKHALMLKELGFEVLLCAQQGREHVKELSKYVEKYNLDIEYLEYSRYVKLVTASVKDIKDGGELSRWIVNNSVGLVHSVTYMPSIGIACKINRIPHVTTLHQFYILITGGAGFIGKSIKKLLMLREKVIILDNFNNYYDEKIKKIYILDIKEMLNKNNI